MSIEFWMALAALIGFGLVVVYLVYDYRGSYEKGEDIVRRLAREQRDAESRVRAAGELERRKLRYGLATLCVGGGMGIATIVERL